MTPAHTVQALASPCMVSVSQCRAAERRRGEEAIFALQMPVVSNTKHQTKGRPAPLRTFVERFAPTAPSAENRLGAREAPVYAVPPLPPLPPLKMSSPESRARPVCWPWGRWPGLLGLVCSGSDGTAWARAPTPGSGSLWSLPRTGT